MEQQNRDNKILVSSIILLIGIVLVGAFCVLNSELEARRQQSKAEPHDASLQNNTTENINQIQNSLSSAQQKIIDQEKQIADLESELETIYDDLSYWEISQYQYRIFYGEWEITEIFGTINQNEDKEQALQRLIGHKIYFDEDEIRLDGYTITEKVCYNIRILPMENREWYYPFDDYPKNEDDVFHLNDSYFVEFDYYIGDWHILKELEGIQGTFMMARYNIKDDNTLILNIGEAGGYAKMERRSYMYEEETDEGFRSWVKIEGEL